MLAAAITLTAINPGTSLASTRQSHVLTSPIPGPRGNLGPIPVQELSAMKVPDVSLPVAWPVWHGDSASYILGAIAAIQAVAKYEHMPVRPVTVAIVPPNQDVTCYGYPVFTTFIAYSCNNVIWVAPAPLAAHIHMRAGNGSLGALIAAYETSQTGPDSDECYSGWMARTLNFLGLFTAYQVMEQRNMEWHFTYYDAGVVTGSCSGPPNYGMDHAWIGSLRRWLGLAA